MPRFGKNARSPLSKQKDRTRKIDVLWNKMDARNGSFATDAFRASVKRCPLCTESDRILQRSEMTLSARCRHALANPIVKDLTFALGKSGRQ
jgi:hypothetical protein